MDANVSLLELDDVIDTCGRCGTGEAELKCLQCLLPYHAQCIGQGLIWEGAQVICDTCYCRGRPDMDPRMNQTIRDIPPMTPRPYGAPRANSTVSLDDHNELRRRCELLEKQVRRLTFGPSPYQPVIQEEPQEEPAVVAPPTPRVVTPRTDFGGDNTRSARPWSRGDRSLIAETWREQVTQLNETLQLEPVVVITQAQRDARKTTKKELPPFDGDSRRYVRFVTTFWKTTAACGFSEEENRERLLACLSGEALRAVNDKLNGYGRIDEIMGRLVQCFGAPTRLLMGMRTVVATLNPLRENLTNLVEFVGVVEEVNAVFKMINRSSAQSELLVEIEAKIPPQIRLQWLSFTRTCDGQCGLSELSEFLNQLVDDALLMHLDVTESSSAKVLKPKPVCTVSSGTTSCCLCEGNHRVDQCFIITQVRPEAQFAKLRELRRCFKCLEGYTEGHRCQLQACGVSGCQKRHLPVMHEAHLLHQSQASPRGRRGFNNNQTSTASGTVTAAPSNQSTSLPCPAPSPNGVTAPALNVHNNCSQSGDVNALFKMVPVTLRNNSKSVEVLAFFDEGSSISLIDEKLADELALQGVVESLTLKWTDSNMRTERESRRVDVLLIGPDDKAFPLRDLRTSRGLDLPMQTITSEISRRLFSDSEGPVLYGGQPRLLLGLPHAHLIAPYRMRRLEGESLMAAETDVGWVIYGGMEKKSPLPSFNYRVCHTSAMPNKVEKMISRFFDFDTFGVRPAPHQVSLEDKLAMDLLEQTVRYNGSRYETGLLWAHAKPHLPDSRSACVRRAKTLQQKMSRDPQLARACAAVIQRYLEKDYIEEVSGRTPCGPVKYYLPIFPVMHPMKPEKTRLVWDAAAKVGGVSLNSVLLSGPDLLTPLPEVLLRFREYAVAVTADIEEMFHQIVIRSEDQSAQRFLWLSVDANIPVEFQMKRMAFGPTCSPTIAQYVKNINAERFIQEYPQAVFAIRFNHYVDDYLGSYPDAVTAYRIAQEVSVVHRHGGFPLKKWRSNSDEVLLKLNGVPTESKELCGPEGRVLGTVWNCADDTLQFVTHHIQELLETAVLTQRVVLKGVMSVFDPLGFAAQLVMYGKLILREVWREVSSWDEPLPPRLTEAWRKWCHLLSDLDRVRVPRWTGLDPVQQWELHTFVDASELAFAAVVYVRGVDPSGQVTVSFVMAKTRVAPLRRATIPRLELQAAVLGVRAATTVAKALTGPLTIKYFWSDSMNVLNWIRSSHRRFHSFVSSRVNEILDSSAEAEWRYVPTEENVADDATRPTEIAVSPRWFQGPAFLRLHCAHWPSQKGSADEMLEEVLQPVLGVQTVTGSNLLPPWTALRSYSQYVRVTAYALRMFYRQHSTDPLTPANILRAEQEIFREVQREVYPEVVGRLQHQNPESLKTSHPLYKLCPLLDAEGLVRVDGRLPVFYPRDVRQPIVLPANHAVTEALVQDVHERYHHCNHSTVLLEIRRRFYIPGLRRLVRRVVSSCRMCRLLFPRTEQPQMGDLPEGRAMVNWKAFSYCGLDYFGPVEVVVGRRREKRWVSLFTCMTTRAIHMEIVGSLSADCFIMALKNFINERSVLPQEIHSDNATTFHGAERALRDTKSPFAEIKWRYIPPGTPHMGGVWERMVRTVKRNLATVLGSDALPEETLRCAIKEVQAIVNAHPLTHVSLDHTESPALTPQDFLSFPGQIPKEVSTGEELDDGSHLRRTWKRAQQLGDHFWRRFAKEVIPILNLRTKWFKRSEPLQVGDQVVVAEEGRRGCWRRGTILEVSPSRRGNQIRAVRVRTTQGDMLRPAVRIAKLDCSPTASAHLGGCKESEE